MTRTDKNWFGTNHFVKQLSLKTIVIDRIRVIKFIKFSVPQIEYPLGGSCKKKGSHVYFLLHVFWVILLFDINVVLMLPWWPDVTIVQSDITIVVPWQQSTGRKHDYRFCYCPLVGIIFEVLRNNYNTTTIDYVKTYDHYYIYLYRSTMINLVIILIILIQTYKD